MKKKYILIAILVILSACSEINLVNIYNKITEPYRGSEYDNNITTSDSSIIIKIIDLQTRKPMKKVRIKLTLPDQDTICKLTDSLGCTTFKFKEVKEGSYTVNALYTKNGEQQSIIESHYLHKKDNLPIIISVTEKNK